MPKNSQSVFDFLKEDHLAIEKSMDDILKCFDLPEADISQAFEKFKKLFNIHDKIEEKAIYPDLKKVKLFEKLTLKSYQAHHLVHIGLLELKLLPFKSETWEPKFLAVRDCILHHMKEEEKILFASAPEFISKNEMELMKEKYLRLKETT